MMDKSKLYGWLFTYNPYTKMYYAAKRDDYFALFSSANTRENDSSVLKSKEISTLEYIICKTDGDIIKIKKLLKQYK